jgi:DNA repair protein RecO (recombination protein O)
MSIAHAEGLVIRVRPFGEADKIITVLTPDQGKFDLVARGSRRPRSRLLGCTQPFMHLKMLIFGGKSLHQLNQAQIIHAFNPLRDDLLKMAYASYWSELINGLLADDLKDENIFSLLLMAFTMLEHLETPDLLSRGFEIKLMSVLGYLPELHVCVGCSRELDTNQLFFSPRAGGILSGCCQGRFPDAIAMSIQAVKSLRYILEADYSAFSGMSASYELRREIRQIIRRFLEERFERPVKSLTFLQGIEEMEGDEV